MNTNSDDLATKLILQGVHVELTPAMQNVIREKFAVLLRHDARIVRIAIRLNKDQTRSHQNHYRATGRIEIGGPDLAAHVEGDNAYNVVDSLVEKLDEMLRDRHERRKTRRHHHHSQPVEVSADLAKAESA